MSDVLTWRVGDAVLTRVLYFDIGLAPDAVGLTPAEVAAVPWAESWTEPGGAVRVGQVLWVIDADGRRLVVDPCGASDAFLRSGPEAVTHQQAALGAMSAARIAPETVDAVVLSHLDGIGMAAVVTDDGWAPAFPRADLVLTAEERAFIADHDDVPGRAAFEELAAAEAVRPVEAPHVLAPGVTLVATGGHSAGHAVITVESGDDRAVLLGHLAVSPLHAFGGPCLGMHEDPIEAWTALTGWLRWAHEHDALVIGPLWPSPGAARVDSVGPTVLRPDPGTPRTAL
jgi:glyoxylase-like metal-dependent hydrolase (beta-lactamase superfamily II)